MAEFTTTYDRGNPAHRTVAEWRHQGHPRSWRTAAQQFARTYGESKALRADGSVIRFMGEQGAVRQRTYRRVAFSDTGM